MSRGLASSAEARFRALSTAGKLDNKFSSDLSGGVAGGNWSLNVYGVIGLADGSPDSGVGLQISLFTN